MKFLVNLLAIATTYLLAPELRGQQVVFDTVRSNVYDGFAIGFGIVEYDSGYAVLSVQRGAAGISQDLFVGRFDFSGALSEEVGYETLQNDACGRSGVWAQSTGTLYAGVSRFGILGETDSLFLYRFDQKGDTLWTRFIATDTAYAMRNISVRSNGQPLLTGIHYPGQQSGNSDAFLIQIDTSGELLAHYDYFGFDGEDVVEGREGTWYVCGLGNTQSNYSHPVLIRSDTLGNELWRRTDELYGRHMSLIALQDGCVLALGNRGTDGGFQRAKVEKFDTSGTQVWLREPWQTNIDSWYCRFHAGFENPDSTLIVAGWVRDTVHKDAGMVFKLDKEGNTIWRRFYSHYPQADYGNNQVFWDVKRTSDGGLILTGETNNDDFPYAQLWLLKLDSMGCLVPGCGSVGVEEYTDLFNGKLVVAPNPAHEMVSVALDLAEGMEVNGQVRALLVDVSGRLVLEQTAQQDLDHLRATVDVSKLPRGTYYVHLRDARRWLAGSKVIVE